MAKNLKLKLARVELDMTQGDLAEAVGVTRQTIGLIEAGKYNPSLSLCQSICRCLGKTLDQLFWEEEDEKYKLWQKFPVPKIGTYPREFLLKYFHPIFPYVHL